MLEELISQEVVGLTKVLLHMFSADGSMQEEDIVAFDRIPVQGECVSVGFNERWFRVERVVLYSDDDNGWSAWVFAVFVEQSDFLRPLIIC